VTGAIKSTLIISFAAFSSACGGGQSRSNTTTPPPPSSTTSPVEVPPRAAPSGNLTLTGCLQRPSSTGATGTAGTDAGERGQARPSGNDTANATPAGAPERYVLSNATVESRAGGPLVSEGTSFELDRVPAGTQVSPGKLVRVTGQIDERSGGAGAASSPNTREDTKANSLTVAGDPTTRRIRVDTIQIVAQDCSSPR